MKNNDPQPVMKNPESQGSSLETRSTQATHPPRSAQPHSLHPTSFTFSLCQHTSLLLGDLSPARNCNIPKHCRQPHSAPASVMSPGSPQTSQGPRPSRGPVPTWLVERTASSSRRRRGGGRPASQPCCRTPSGGAGSVPCWAQGGAHHMATRTSRAGGSL